MYGNTENSKVWRFERFYVGRRLTWALFATLLMQVKSFAKESKYLKCWRFVCLPFLCPFSFSPLNVARILQPIHYRLLQPLRRMFFCQQQWGKSVYPAHRISLQAWPLLQTVEHNNRKVIRHDGTMDAWHSPLKWRLCQVHVQKLKGTVWQNLSKFKQWELTADKVKQKLEPLKAIKEGINNRANTK